MSYLRFAAMFAASTAAIVGLMYLNTYALDHVFWSETRAWMALVMGAVMAVLMLAFMHRMYPKAGWNLPIFAGAGAVFAIALMTSRRARIADPRVRELEARASTGDPARR